MIAVGSRGSCPNPVAVAVELSDDERAQLEAWARRRLSAQALAQRARIVLLAAEGTSLWTRLRT